MTDEIHLLFLVDLATFAFAYKVKNINVKQQKFDFIELVIKHMNCFSWFTLFHTQKIVIVVFVYICLTWG